MVSLYVYIYAVSVHIYGCIYDDDTGLHSIKLRYTYAVYCTHSHSLCNHLTALLFTMFFEPSRFSPWFSTATHGFPCVPTEWQKCHNQCWQYAGNSEAAESSSREFVGHRHWAAHLWRSGALELKAAPKKGVGLVEIPQILSTRFRPLKTNDYNPPGISSSLFS